MATRTSSPSPSSSPPSSCFMLICLLHSAIAISSGAFMMFRMKEIYTFTHGIETATKLLGSTPHDQLLIRTSDSFSGLLLFTIGFLLFMVSFVEDTDFQSFFAAGCTFLHVFMAVPAQQSSAWGKFVKLFVLLACAMAFRLLISTVFQKTGLIPSHSAVDDLADPAAAGTADTAADTAAVAGGQEAIDREQLVQDTAGDAGSGPETPAQFVARSIKENRVIVFSKSYCPYSMRGKDIMRRLVGTDGVAVVELDHREDGSDIQDELQRITGARTVPRIFVDSKCLGGADDVGALERSGELAQLLRDKGLASGTAAAAA